MESHSYIPAEGSFRRLVDPGNVFMLLLLVMALDKSLPGRIATKKENQG